MVACLTDARGRSLPQPVRVDTADKAHAVQAVVGERSVGPTAPLEKLLAALAA